MRQIDFKEPIGDSKNGIRNWSGVLKLQRPLFTNDDAMTHQILYYDKEREHEGFIPLDEFPTRKAKNYFMKHIFHGEPKTYWLVHIIEGIWHFDEEVEPYDW